MEVDSADVSAVMTVSEVASILEDKAVEVTSYRVLLVGVAGSNVEKKVERAVSDVVGLGSDAEIALPIVAAEAGCVGTAINEVEEAEGDADGAKDEKGSERVVDAPAVVDLLVVEDREVVTAKSRGIADSRRDVVYAGNEEAVLVLTNPTSSCELMTDRLATLSRVVVPLLGVPLLPPGLLKKVQVLSANVAPEQPGISEHCLAHSVKLSPIEDVVFTLFGKNVLHCTW